ncbi:hypothetical protein OPV22_034637 [Ensete ventricosum]|uniref:Uncharacterized protein n=1 Tax=Ensete ventricosum TaxID=4639 RepID=A0AAV8P237_ENSVE|nr:hypothetical protein OPV22_034637 [Ensete ventricosum]
MWTTAAAPTATAGGNHRDAVNRHPEEPPCRKKFRDVPDQLRYQRLGLLSLEDARRWCGQWNLFGLESAFESSQE